ncbi:ATP-binding protein [Nocardia aurantia]|uniref:AAA+ ATPase domain-containing protein n=1 Tax=Nocardia aurantia TaxID=2585199 RepID=A0A7K0DQH9_9NOCA|nr:ATP-binding protein [Nocardia aurantia]MQY28030.1 hypothetical protein [Nocardia aurantia]
MRTFNTTGQCDPELHYMLPAQARLPKARGLIEQGLYFVVHAPRQTGKTTTLTALADALSAENEQVAVLVSCETAQVAGDDYSAAEDIVLYSIREAVLDRDYPESWLPPSVWPDAPPGTKIKAGLRAWARQCPVPIVLLLDEVDAMHGQSMMTLLRQLRDGFRVRPKGFPASVVLSGLRDIREYKAASGGDPARLGGASPFNIAVDSMRIGDFSVDDIAALYGQYTTDSGQPFTEDALQRVFAYSAGQPWLVNAIARQILVEIEVRPPVPITADHIDEATRRLIDGRAVHLDSVVAKLAEPRVRRIVEPLIAGLLPEVDPSYNDDVAYVRDLGLIARDSPVAVANPIYREVLARVLAQPVMDMVTDSPRSFILSDGRIDLDKLLREFVAFWREKGAMMAVGRGYNEAGAQLVLLGYLYRIVNGGGFVDSEYGVGTGRVEIFLRKPYTGTDGKRAVQREAMELKVWWPGREDPVDEGLDQLDSYLAGVGLETGTLVIFDRRPGAAPLSERGVFTEEVTAEGRKVQLLRI